MKVKFVIPVVDTESGTYEYHGRDFTADEYFNMIQSKANQTRQVMDEFAFNYKNGVSTQFNVGNRVNNLYDSENVNTNKEIDYNFSSSEALILDGDDNDIKIDDLNNFVQNGKKFLLKVNINPNSLDGDAESELRNWLDDSSRVLNDKLLDNRTMLLSLPLRNFIIDTAESEDDKTKPIFQIINCRVIQVYPKKTSGYDYYFVIMCGEIRKQ